MNTTRRQLCFMVSALCGGASLGSAVETFCESSYATAAVDLKNSTVPANQLLTLLSGGTHEVASQLELVAGFTELAQEKIESGELATVKAHLDTVQRANQRAWAALNMMTDQIRGRKRPAARG